MIKVNGKRVAYSHFPDGTLRLSQELPKDEEVTITWMFENNEELLVLYFLNCHLKAQGGKQIILQMPYLPNARQDRVKHKEDVFTLKYFANIINAMNFCKVRVLDPHSYVSEALIDRLQVDTPERYVQEALARICAEDSVELEDVMLFYPDEGAMKRYRTMFDMPYAFGIKQREWETGEIKGLEVAGQTARIEGSTVLMVDDICSRGGTFYYSAKRLAQLGANTIYLFISHCENTILEGDLLASGLVKKVYTTDSIFTKQHEKVEVFDYE